MFDKLIGNEDIKEILRQMIVKGRVPRSLLFAGQEGIGKRRFALETAKSFVCHATRAGEACDRCAACRRADKFEFPKTDDREAHKKLVFSEYPDIGQIVPYGKNILVDAVRDLEREANFRPYEAQARFFIIDDADRMNDAASNALLKTLEEPAATTYLFLVTSRPDSLLQTIRSRCQTIRFAPVAGREIESLLLTTKKFAPDDAALVARLAAGSIGRALDFDLERFRARRELMLKVLRAAVARGDRLTLLKAGEEINDAKNKDDYELYLEILQTLIRDLWSISLGAEESLTINVDLRPALGALAERAEKGKLVSWMNEIETLRERLAVNVNRKIAADALFMEMARA